MAIVIQPYRPEHEPAVAEFNQRLRQAGEDENMVFYRWAEPRWLPRRAESRIYNEFFVAVDDGIVRGGYALKTQDFFFPDGQTRSIAYYHHPLSEGIVNKAHAMVGTLLLRDAMQRAPLLYCLGMGGYDRPLPRMLVRLGWVHGLVPFFFRIVNPSRFLRNMQTLRSSPSRKFLLDIAAYSGAGWAGSKLFQSYRALLAPRSAATEGGEVESFESEAEGLQTLWEQARQTCSLTAVRDAEALRTLYPPAQEHLTRLVMKRNGVAIGWAVVGERRKDSKYGNLRVGSVVDCFALLGELFSVVRSATQTLERQGFDLILSNQSHQAWGEAFKAAGYLAGPSNFLFAASKKLAELLAPFEQVRPRMHLTRADGDGLPGNF
ncbi:MAG TPA: hypothetical protein VJX69_09295 [Terriglobales bacterium]|nr:hypothetical protein [Terriglobales bacterium]